MFVLENDFLEEGRNKRLKTYSTLISQLLKHHTQNWVKELDDKQFPTSNTPYVASPVT